MIVVRMGDQQPHCVARQAAGFGRLMRLQAARDGKVQTF